MLPAGLTFRARHAGVGGTGRQAAGRAGARPLPDRIAAATYAAALACAAERYELPAATRPVRPFLRFLAATGVQVSPPGTAAGLARNPAVPLRGGANLCADAWPAFATDTAPLAAAVLLTADGESEIYDRLFANRFACAAGFAAMGAAAPSRGVAQGPDGGEVLHETATSLPPICAAERRFWPRHWPRTVRPACATPGTSPGGYEDLPGALRGLGAEIS